MIERNQVLPGSTVGDGFSWLAEVLFEVIERKGNRGAGVRVIARGARRVQDARRDMHGGMHGGTA